MSSTASEKWLQTAKDQHPHIPFYRKGSRGGGGSALPMGAGGGPTALGGPGSALEGTGGEEQIRKPFASPSPCRNLNTRTACQSAALLGSGGVR